MLAGPVKTFFEAFVRVYMSCVAVKCRVHKWLDEIVYGFNVTFCRFFLGGKDLPPIGN